MIIGRCSNEQTRFERQQPHAMRTAPFDFELDAQYRKAARMDAIISCLAIIGFIALLVL